jgi:hypothetical protein
MLPEKGLNVKQPLALFNILANGTPKEMSIEGVIDHQLSELVRKTSKTKGFLVRWHRWKKLYR